MASVSLGLAAFRTMPSGGCRAQCIERFLEAVHVLAAGASRQQDEVGRVNHGTQAPRVVFHGGRCIDDHQVVTIIVLKPLSNVFEGIEDVLNRGLMYQPPPGAACKIPLA